MPAKRRSWTLMLLAAAAVLITGCSPYYERFPYGSQAQTASITPPDAPKTPPLRALATITGIRRADSKTGQPAGVELQFRLDNDSNRPATLDPTSLELLDAALQPMPKPLVEPAQPLTVPPGQSATVRALFPLRPKQSYYSPDLYGLSLRWSVDVGGQRVTRVTTFRHRPDVYYYDPYWYPYGYYYGYPYGYYPYGYYGPYPRWHLGIGTYYRF